MALSASKHGERLLVGRDDSLKFVTSRIVSDSKAVTIEGANGIGKTSLANVASYQVSQKSLKDKSNRLFLPCRKSFQLEPDTNSKDFRHEVLLEVVQTLLEHRENLTPPAGRTRSDQGDKLDAWLNNVETKSFQLGVLGNSIGYGKTNVSSEGFDKSGFDKAATDWLASAFDGQNSGGIICIVDNLELLKTSNRACDLLEMLRDVLFNTKGLRWILSGARGIIDGVASSPRLEGYLHEPISLKDIPMTSTSNCFKKRIEEASSKKNPFMPVRPTDFQELLEIFHGNLRATLSSLDDFCRSVFDAGYKNTEAVPVLFFSDWIEAKAKRTFDAVNKAVGKEGIFAFRKISLQPGIRPIDYRNVHCQSAEELRGIILDLEKFGVVALKQESDDPLRNRYTVSAKGRLIVWLFEKEDKFHLINRITPRMPPDDEWYVGSQWSGETSTE